MHESELERARLEFSPPKSTHIYAEIKSFFVEPSSFWYIFVQLQYPSKRSRPGRHHVLYLHRPNKISNCKLYAPTHFPAASLITTQKLKHCASFFRPLYLTILIGK
ncbi:hypothetical protein Hanom_Chr04g00366041 [Helianthus anomalus]